jgi:hypothetical protein
VPVIETDAVSARASPIVQRPMLMRSSLDFVPSGTEAGGDRRV